MHSSLFFSSTHAVFWGKKMKKLFRIVQFGANLGIIVIGLLLTFIVLDRYVISPTKSDQNPVVASNTSSTTLPRANNLIGTVLPLQGVAWKESNMTVVLYLSTTCRFCSESSPFYQQLVKAKANNAFKLVAVLPQNTDEANKYLESLNIKVDQVLNSSLTSVGVTGTPTLMMVGEDGVIIDSWRGKLDEKKEGEVFAKLSN